MAFRFRTRLIFTISSLLVLSVLVLTGVFAFSSVANFSNFYYNTGRLLTILTNRNVQYAASLEDKVAERISEQMAVSAYLAAELVAIAEAPKPADPEDVERALQNVIQETREWKDRPIVDEFNITDDRGRIYISTAGKEFQFMPDAESTGRQSSEFWTLLQPDAEPVVQDVRPRDLDNEPYKYVGVSGTDKPRIVQVGASEDAVSAALSGFELQQFVELFLQEENIKRILVMDHDGRVQADAAASYYTASSQLDRDIRSFCLDFLATPGQEVNLDFFGSDVGVVTPVDVPAPEGPLALFIQFNTFENIGNLWTLLRYLGISGLIIIFLGIAASIILGRSLSKPMVQLTEAAHEFGEGNFNHRIALKRNDEFQQLAHAFNSMAISLQEKVYELQREASERERLESELRIAKEMQQSLLPDVAPQIESLDIRGWSHPAKEVGGDFYDYIQLDEHRLAIAIGDATGKGLAAAMLINQCASILHTIAREVQSPGDLLREVNDELCERTSGSFRFVTLFYLVLDTRTGTARYAVAGHNPPIVTGINKHEAHFVESPGGFPLGIVAHSNFPEGQIELSAGDTLFLYTDGLPDARNVAGEMYGEQRMVALLRKHVLDSAPAVIDAVARDIEQHIAGREPFDDITVVALRFRPPQ